MATRRRIALYFDLAFEQDRRLFGRLAPYLRRKRGNEVLKAALEAWVERQDAISEAERKTEVPEPVHEKEGASSTQAAALIDGSGGVRELLERFAARQPDESHRPDAPATAQVEGSEASPGFKASPAAGKPRLGRLM